MKNRNVYEILLYYGLIFIMVMSLNLAVRDCTGMDITYTRMVLFTLLATAAAAVTVLFPVVVPSALLPAAGWIAFRYYRTPEEIKLYWIKIKEFLNWFHGYASGQNYFEPGYSLVFVLMYAFLSALVISLIVYSGKSGFALILAGTAALSYFWFIYVEKARWYLAFYLFAAVLYYSYRIYRKRFREWSAADSAIERDVGHNWMLCSAAVILISLALSFALPLNISPVRWNWLNDKVVSLFPFISEWRNDSQESFAYGYNSRFSLNSAGYLDKKLGGELRQDSSVLMTVRTKGKETLYLRGTVRDRYSENNWYKARKKYREYKMGEAMPLPFGEAVNTYEKEMEITYERLLTSTIFAPYSIYQVRHNSRRVYIDEDSEVYTSKMTIRKESYTVKSRIPYIDVNKLRQAKAENLEISKYGLYTSVAPEIPDRVRALAQEITKEQNNNYDKAKSVEKYLRENYKYVHKPPKLPERADFTDHFLFEGKEGYCTYFATAMTALLRAADVPCRYVEGFVAVYDGKETREIRGTDAHAWVEVYFDDYGWVTFEPTPQYPEFEFIEQASDTVVDTSASAEADTERNPDTAAIARDRREPEEREEMVSGDEYTNVSSRHINIGNILLLALLGLLTARIIYRYVCLATREINLGRARGRRFAMVYLDDIIMYLGHAGFEMKKEETLREFLQRIKGCYEEGISNIPGITAIVEKIRYGSHEPSNEERRLLEVFRKDVKRLALRNAGIIKIITKLYIIGK